MNKKYKYVDLFAGIGGLTHYLHSNGHECIGVSEIDKFALLTYRANHPNISNDCYFGSLDCVPPIPNIDIITAGVPCTSFSVAGKKLGLNDPNVGHLFDDTIKMIGFNQPKVFLIENVKGLLTNNKGKTFKYIKEQLEIAGYTVHYQVLKAEEFGMPQTRHRVYIVGLSNTAFKDTSFEFPEPTKVATTLGSILESKPEDKYTLTDSMWSYLVARKQEQKDKGNGFGYKMYTKSSPYVGTLSARYGKDGSEILIKEEWLLSTPNPRRLTPRECARLQGFPDTFDITACSDTQLYKQFGNSVCVPVVNEIMKKIISKLDSI